MWFKNIRLYRLISPFSLSPEELHERLLAFAFQPCGPLEPARTGWVPPLGRHGSLLTHAASGCVLLCARKEQRVLPAAVVREAVDARVQAIEEAQGRTVRRKERLEIRDEVLYELLPKAFTRSSLIRGYLSLQDGYLAVDAAGAPKAEEFMSLLRDALGSLPLVPVAVRQPVALVMSRWLTGAATPKDFLLGDECELREPGDQGGVIRCRREDLATDEIRAHVGAGKLAVRLGLSWAERLSFVLGEDLTLHRLRFSDVLQEEARRDLEAEDPIARIDADFSLMTLELSRLIAALLEAFGGEDRAAYAPAGQAA
jgi:recombination associated protein RdgC